MQSHEPLPLPPCRQELLSVECQLLQNALESQKQSTCIKLCEEGREEEEEKKEAVASPDSGTVLSPLEPAGVAASREELASLARDKLQLEALHCQLQKQLRDNKRENTKLQEVCHIIITYCIHLYIVMQCCS